MRALRRTLPRTHLLTRQLHTSLGRSSETPFQQAARAAVQPVIQRTGSVFDPSPSPAPSAPPTPLPTSPDASPLLHEPTLESALPSTDLQSSQIHLKLSQTLGPQTLANLLPLLPLALIKDMSERCIYADYETLAVWMRENMFGFLREAPKSEPEGLFKISDFVIPTTRVSSSIRHRLRMCARISLDALWRKTNLHPLRVDARTLFSSAEEDEQEERTGMYTPEYAQFRLEHGDHKAHVGLAYAEELEIRRMLASHASRQSVEQAGKRLRAHLEEAARCYFGGAAFKLGSLLEEGVVLPRDVRRMVECYEQALLLGKTAAAARLADLYQPRPKYKQQAPSLLVHDKRKSLMYHELAASERPSSAVYAAFNYYLRPGATWEEHVLTFSCEPDDDKAAMYFWMAHDRASWLSKRVLADMLMLDRTDVPLDKQDDRMRLQPKRVRQLEWAVRLIKEVPPDSTKTVALFTKGRAESLGWANELLAQAKKGGEANVKNPRRLGDWNPWVPSLEAVRSTSGKWDSPRSPRAMGVQANAEEEGTGGEGKVWTAAEKRQKYAQFNEFEERKRRTMVATLMSMAKKSEQKKQEKGETS